MGYRNQPRGPGRVLPRCAGGDASDVCSFAVGHILHIPEHEDLAEQMEKLLDESMYHAVFFMPYQDRFRCLAIQLVAGAIKVLPYLQFPGMRRYGKDSPGVRFIPGTVIVFVEEAP